MKTKIKKLTEEQLKLISLEFDTMTFNNDFDFVYEEQVPNTAIILTDGELKLYRKNKLLEIVDPGHVLGAYNLLHNEPVKYACKVGKQSKAILLDKSTLLEAYNNPTSSLSLILGGLVKD